MDVEAFIADHPDHADELRRLLPAVQMLADLSRSGDAGASDLDGDDRLGDVGRLPAVREVGRGGMGVVYEAEQVSLGRRVALKVLPFAATMDPRQLQRFQNEAQAAAMLHHPHIVPVYGVGCERGVHYYAMQFIEGRSLAAVIDELRAGSRQPRHGSADHGDCRRLDRGGRHPPLAGRPTAPVAALSTQKTRRDKAHYRRVAELVAQAADALEHAHSPGHRPPRHQAGQPAAGRRPATCGSPTSAWPARTRPPA